MTRTLLNPAHASLPVRADKCINAQLRKPETDAYRLKLGAVIERARCIAGWTLDELSGHVQRDPRQVAKWINGTERPQFDALFAVDDATFRNGLVLSLAELGSGVVVDTVIRLQLTRTA